MAQKLLINVAVEETRVALVSSGTVTNLEIDTASLDQARGNIYKGVVHRVNPSLQAAFVDYGAEKQGFLPVSEIHPDYYPERVRGMKVPIQDILHNGQELMIQVMKDEIGSKGAGLSTYISIPGRYLVLMAESGKTGISRRLPDDERQRLKSVVDGLDVPEGFGVIIRTAGVERPQVDLESDLSYLRRLWKSLDDRFKGLKEPGLLHQERSIALRFIRDYATTDLEEIICDDTDTVEEIQDFCEILMPEMRMRVRHYGDPTPLFSRYQVEDQIDDIFARRIDLPSGGYLVIDQTEALVACDVNSGRVKTDDIEKTALKTNLEAATEMARQLKIRDLGGLVIVDFIDMREKDNIRSVEKRARESFAEDKAKVKFTRISDFGLMEISRQRLKTSIMKGSFENCDHCGGTGKLRSTESSALYLLRRLKETVIRGNYLHASAQMPVNIANYVLNRKRRDLLELEAESNTTIEVHGRPDCAPTAAYVELLTRPMKGKRPRRMVQTFDLVRSEVEKKELDEGDDLLVAAAGARGVSLNTEEYRELYRKIEKDMIQELQQKLVESEVRDRAQIAVDEKLKIGDIDPRRGPITVIHEAPNVVERSGGLAGFFKTLFYGKPVEADSRPRQARAGNRPERPPRQHQAKDRPSGQNRQSQRGARTRPAPVMDSGPPEQKKQTAHQESAPDRQGAPGSSSSSRRRRRGRGKGRRQGGDEASAVEGAAQNQGGEQGRNTASHGSAKTEESSNPNSSSNDRSSSSNDRSSSSNDRSSSSNDRSSSSNDRSSSSNDRSSSSESNPRRGRSEGQGGRGGRRSSPRSSNNESSSQTSSTPQSAPTQASSGSPAPMRKEAAPRPPKVAAKPKEAPKKVTLPKVGGVIDLRGGAPSTPASASSRPSPSPRPSAKPAESRPEPAAKPYKPAEARSGGADAAKPAAKSTAGKPAAAKPVVAKKAEGETKPAAAKRKPAAKKPAASGDGASASTTKKPARKKPASDEKKPVAKKAKTSESASKPKPKATKKTATADKKAESSTKKAATPASPPAE
jgi:ribonuclease E